MCDCRYRCLSVRGELWAAYPDGMRFPACFSRCYPMRGGGKVSRILYVLNRVYLDRLVVRLRNDFRSKHLPPLVHNEQVAFFWPSASRSTGRFYGYRVVNGAVTEYWKLATSTDEQVALKQEAENTKVAMEIAGGVFRVPSCLGVEMRNGVLVVRYEALPPDAQRVQLDEKWLRRIVGAREAIARAGYQHGDFGWHNMKAVGDELWILDWEEMSKGLPYLTDEISFDAMVAYYNEGRKLECVCQTLRKHFQGAEDEMRLAIESMASRRIAMGGMLKERLSRP